jgi:hypothetical protein
VKYRASLEESKAFDRTFLRNLSGVIHAVTSTDSSARPREGMVDMAEVISDKPEP